MNKNLHSRIRKRIAIPSHWYSPVLNPPTCSTSLRVNASHVNVEVEVGLNGKWVMQSRLRDSEPLT